MIELTYINEDVSERKYFRDMEEFGQVRPV